MKNIMFDIETLGTESTAVVLSFAAIPFELNETPTYQELLDRALFVKLDAEQQIKVLKRTVEKGTIDWWAKQSELARQKSFHKDNKRDTDCATGLTMMRNVLGLKPVAFDNPDVVFWARGSLDQVVIDSLSKQVHNNLVIPFNNWRDVRTAVDLLVEGASGGYCKVPNFSREIVVKHDPVHDCAYDIMQLLANNFEA
jgi:hypothetical protein